MTKIPVDIGRAQARELARDELAGPSYDLEPSLVARVAGRLLDWLGDLLDRAGGALSGPLAAALLIILVIGVVGVILFRGGPLARRATSARHTVFDAERRSAAEHRAAADTAADRGDWATAIIERYRAVIAGLEERTVLDPRAGRTADEAASEAGVALPALAEPLLVGAHTFDRVRYGGHSAATADDVRMRELDDAIRRAGQAQLAVPR